ncbi:MAG: 3-oxoacyl-[acyl-carrier-protein] reductase [Pseudomonadota bacterium]|nr:3-oxoacyl-[acyl-carrier-protein] reductase [Pseudomonadota bacterium]MEC7830610.1 3-oxoacyl-[acyl-carrier-protein] reductase [Pseudomonadota bacterium]MEC9382578.1 3-oxoacyl-[acyl-carrier-protein] reductase [Pseudomonadota bacterium]MEC9481334.1 3-oxoacyl-[acyl-carrier-protein] reductase [Pseudomonadota bacterium]
MFDLKGKKALITGASGGIGKEIAKTLDGYGAEICISGRNTEELDLLNDTINQDCKIITCDLTKDQDIKNLVEGAQESLGQIDILVNNAGITKDNIFLRMSDEEWNQVLQVNLYSTFKILKLVTKGMVKRKYGRIINITSVVGVTGGPGQVNYSSSKAGLIGMTKSLSQELASRNITVNCIAPGFIDTPMTSDLDENRKGKVLESIPANRFGSPKDLSTAILFLASEESSYITGQTIHINGGLYMN